MKNKLNHFLYRSIGFMNYDKKFMNDLKENGFKNIKEDKKSISFLQSSYHTEYLKIMFSEDESYGVSKLRKEINLTFSIPSKNIDVTANNIEIFCFYNKYQKEQIAIFSIEYLIKNPDLDKISDISYALKFHDTEIIFKNKNLKLKDFLSKEFLINHSFTDEESLVEQFAGIKFKNYIILDFENQIKETDDLLFEIGTTSKIGTIKENNINAPSKSYKEKTLKNMISCFNNYKCLSLLDSFTVIGVNNYNDDNIYTKKTWQEIYFSIYIFNLYVKCTLQILSNHFSIDPMEKRKEFQNFYNKYYFKKISFNFLPNEIFKGISLSMEIEEDIEFINQRLETVAIQVNEKQQKQQEMLLFAISVIALLETPLHVEGIREIIGINEIQVYNITTYSSLALILALFLIIKLRRKY